MMTADEQQRAFSGTRPVAPTDHRLQAEQRLRAAGLRATPARITIIDVLARRDHATPEQIRNAAQHLRPALSTVYRTLDALCDAGMVGRSAMHGGYTFHLTDHRGHMHLSCVRCGGLQAVGPEAARILAAELLAREGFRADARHLVVDGLCRACAR